MRICFLQVWAKYQRAMEEGFETSLPCYLGMEELVDLDQPGMLWYSLDYRCYRHVDRLPSPLI